RRDRRRERPVARPASARCAPTSRAAGRRAIVRPLSRPGGCSRLDDRGARSDRHVPWPLAGPPRRYRHFLDRAADAARPRFRLVVGLAMDARAMSALAPLGWFVVGFLAGAVCFALLRWNAALYACGGSAVCAIILQLGRLTAIAAALLFVVLHGAL